MTLEFLTLCDWFIKGLAQKNNLFVNHPTMTSAFENKGVKSALFNYSLYFQNEITMFLLDMAHLAQYTASQTVCSQNMICFAVIQNSLYKISVFKTGWWKWKNCRLSINIVEKNNNLFPPHPPQYLKLQYSPIYCLKIDCCI